MGELIEAGIYVCEEEDGVKKYTKVDGLTGATSYIDTFKKTGYTLVPNPSPLLLYLKVYPVAVHVESIQSEVVYWQYSEDYSRYYEKGKAKAKPFVPSPAPEPLPTTPSQGT